ncbi:unnamed protein product [Acanthoscelides obtectus]|uniref:TNFR-Cys domain-containing protein n=1 Tax=Acanthoscelides obtectus TaxID=200917 RepID=A0A9P0M5R9_ACAOB|nr:unnamed protein product [Acanthoscelides obtectus]CAK1626497.1 hypothetical protein AOBTE_LOCUS3882 [Acanthoscelides obtectus]
MVSILLEKDTVLPVPNRSFTIRKIAHRQTQEMVVSFALLLTICSLPLIAAASLCPEKQFLHSRLQTCLNCSECGHGLVALRPCELHRDTHCGPISELIKTLQASQGGGPHHRHRHQGRRKEHEAVQGAVNGEDIVWRYGDDIQKKIDQAPSMGSEGVPLKPLAMEVSSSEAPFSGAETLVWDWQAVALTTAVFACILFFLAVTLYSLHQARQWRRLKENFEAGTFLTYFIQPYVFLLFITCYLVFYLAEKSIYVSYAIFVYISCLNFGI